MTSHRRPGRIALVGGIALSLGLAGIAVAWAGLPGAGTGPVTVEIPIHYSHYERSLVTVRAGVPVTFVLHNTDPIDHEWIVGDAAAHERHLTGTEPVHVSRLTELSFAAGTQQTNTLTFNTPGKFLHLLTLPGHEAYGTSGAIQDTAQ